LKLLHHICWPKAFASINFWCKSSKIRYGNRVFPTYSGLSFRTYIFWPSVEAVVILNIVYYPYGAYIFIALLYLMKIGIIGDGGVLASAPRIFLSEEASLVSMSCHIWAVWPNNLMCATPWIVLDYIDQRVTRSVLDKYKSISNRDLTKYCTWNMRI